MAGHLRPLAGKNALIACSEMKAARLTEGLQALGAAVGLLPVIEVREWAEAANRADPAFDRLAEYSWIIFTSGYGVRYFLEALRKNSLSPSACSRHSICAVGPGTAEILRQSGLPATLVPREFVAEGIIAALTEHCGGLHGLAGQRILLPRARVARDLLPEALQAAGALVTVVPCYETIIPQIDPQRIEAVLSDSSDILVFTSSTTVRNFAVLFGERGIKMLQKTTVAVMGPITARTFAEYGKRADIIPAENTIPSLLAAIRDYYLRLI